MQYSNSNMKYKDTGELRMGPVYHYPLVMVGKYGQEVDWKHCRKLLENPPADEDRKSR